MGMRKYFVCALALASVVASGSVWAKAGSGSASGVATTHKRVHGIITSLEGQELTIAPLVTQATMTGRIDPKRTRIEVDGKTARPIDLEVTLSANAELGLDDVWVSVRATTR